MLTSYSINRLNDIIYKNTSHTPSSTLYLGLLSRYTYIEKTGDNYSRVSINPSFFSVAAVTENTYYHMINATYNSSAIFPTVTGSTWTQDSIYYLGVYDSPTGGNLLMYVQNTVSTSGVAVGKALRYFSGSIVFKIQAGSFDGYTISEHLGYEILTFILHNSTFNPISQLYIALFNNTTTLANLYANFLGGEMAWSGYSRQPITFSEINDIYNSLANNNNVVFTTNTTATKPYYIAIMDAITGGNVLLIAPIPNRSSLPTPAPGEYLTVRSHAYRTYYAGFITI